MASEDVTPVPATTLETSVVSDEILAPSPMPAVETPVAETVASELPIPMIPPISSIPSPTNLLASFSPESLPTSPIAGTDASPTLPPSPHDEIDPTVFPASGTDSITLEIEPISVRPPSTPFPPSPTQSAPSSDSIPLNRGVGSSILREDQLVDLRDPYGIPASYGLRLPLHT